MLTDSDELTIAWRALANQKNDSGITSIAFGSSGSRLRAAILYPGREEALLIGFGVAVANSVRTLPEGAGFRVEFSKEAIGGGYDRWLCLTRQSGASLDLFLKMASDISALVATNANLAESRLVTILLSRIHAWQDFMKQPQAAKLSDDAEAGLAGELMMFARLAEAGVRSGDIAAWWQGPARGLRDFEAPQFCVEVKTTLSVNGFPATISSLEQLDTTIGQPVYVTALRLSLQFGGKTLPDLVADIRLLVSEDMRALAMLNAALGMAGYTDASSEKYTRRFAEADCRIFRVSEGFPFLIRTQTPSAILSATYRIDLDLVTTPSLSFTDMINETGVATI